MLICLSPCLTELGSLPEAVEIKGQGGGGGNCASQCTQPYEAWRADEATRWAAEVRGCVGAASSRQKKRRGLLPWLTCAKAT